jgi:hypothetical protein
MDFSFLGLVTQQGQVRGILQEVIFLIAIVVFYYM